MSGELLLRITDSERDADAYLDTDENRYADSNADQFGDAKSNADHNRDPASVRDGNGLRDERIMRRVVLRESHRNTNEYADRHQHSERDTDMDVEPAALPDADTDAHGPVADTDSDTRDLYAVLHVQQPVGRLHRWWGPADANVRKWRVCRQPSIRICRDHFHRRQCLDVRFRRA